MNTFPKEFSWHLKYPGRVEKPRAQIYGTCWAHSLASIIGDNFSMNNKLDSVYPSSFWITSMRKDACKFFNKRKDVCKEGEIGINNGFIESFMAHFMKENSDTYYTKLEQCYPNLATIRRVLAKTYFEYKDKSLANSITYPPISAMEWMKGNSLDLEYLGYILPECCTNKIMINRYYNRFYCQPYILSPNLEKIDMLKKNVKFKVQNMAFFNYTFKFKEEYSEQDIKNMQQQLKKYILCYGEIMSTIIATRGYKEFFYNSKRKYTDIFYPDTQPKETERNHAVIILGWGNDDGQEYWWIRDSNAGHFYPPRYYKIAFSRFDNKDYWFGPDLLWKEENNVVIGEKPSFLITDPIENIDELLEAKIFQKSR